MQARIDGRRAAPPRPTLLVGDLAACHAAFDRLQQQALALSLRQQASIIDEPESSTVDAWRDMVPRCRALRETLTSLRELSHFTREVYEAAADVCARAHDWPEAFKALQQLVNLIYPALAEQQAQQAGSSERPGASTGLAGRPPWGSAGATAQGAGEPGTSEEGLESGRLAADALHPSITAAALSQPRFRRWPEAAAALVLYFASAQQEEADTLTTLRQLPPAVLASGEVQAALRLRAALCDNNYVALFRLRAAAPPLVQLVTGAAAQRARESALAVMASAYRSIAVGAVCQALQLAGLRQLLACLKLLADRGHLAAQRAMSSLQQEEQPSEARLVFKG